MKMSSNTSRKPRIGIIGIGMVGEPIMRWFGEIQEYRRGKNLFCYDTDPKKGFTDDINRADIIFVAVPTPPNPDGSCNISIVESTVKTIKNGKIIVIKSTVAPGTIEKIQKNNPGKRIISNPEFLTESQSWLDFLKPDRQIIAHTAKSYSDVKEILTLLPRAYFERPWSSDYLKKSANATEAELAKYAGNVFGYLKVIYGNILADISHALSLNFKNNKINASVDYENVREIISADPRIGPAWLNVSHGNYCGSGGYCFPKDMTAFIKFTQNLTEELRQNKKTDLGLVDSLTKGVGILKAVESYNKALLKWQGLTIEEVSRHDKDLVIQKHKKIRNKE